MRQLATPEDRNVVSIWTKLSVSERDALKAIADKREQTMSQLVRFALKEKFDLS